MQKQADDRPAEGASPRIPLRPEDAVTIIEQTLREQFELAKPDDVAFLEFQSPRIAAVIAARLGLLDGPLK